MIKSLFNNGEAEAQARGGVINILFTSATRDFSQQEAIEKLRTMVKMDQPEGTIAITPLACQQLLKCLTPSIPIVKHP